MLVCIIAYVFSLIIYITNSGKNDMNYLSCKSISFWSNNFFQVCKEAKKGGGVPCSTYLLKESQKNIWMSHLETSCSSDLQFLNIVPLLCPAYTFSKVFIREDWTEGGRVGGRSQLWYTLKTCNNSKKFCKPSSNIERGRCWKVMQASLKPPSFSIYASRASNSFVISFICNEGDKKMPKYISM